MPAPSSSSSTSRKNFYFLEMNTRLQVEHPVTELVTGLDLVHLQIHIANGEPLPFTQEQVTIRGHAIECRIYAEDPDNNYFPSPGKITLLLLPSGPGIRRDSGMYEGWNVPMDYDPLLAKLIGYGTDRDQAIGRLTRALNEYFVGGIKTNISLFRRILSNPDFRAAKIDTGFLDRLLKQKNQQPGPRVDPHVEEVAVIAAGMFAVLGSAAAGTGERPVISDAANKTNPGFELEERGSSGGSAVRKSDYLDRCAANPWYFMTYEIAIDGKNHRLDLEQVEGRWSCRLDGREVEVDAVLARPERNFPSHREPGIRGEMRASGRRHAYLGWQRALRGRSPRSTFAARASSRRR